MRTITIVGVRKSDYTSNLRERPDGTGRRIRRRLLGALLDNEEDGADSCGPCAVFARSPLRRG